MEEAAKKGSYLIALNRMRELIGREYEHGGRLPGARELAKRLNVSLETYMKALRELCAEEIACTTKGRGGTFIRPKNERLEMVGLIIYNGHESPLIGGAVTLKIMERMHRENRILRLVSAANLEDIPLKAAQHGVRALVWLQPPLQALPVIGAIQKEGLIPLVVSDVFDASVRKALLDCGYNIVTNDYRYAGKLVTDFCFARNLSRLFYIGGKPSFEAHGFPGFFAERGIRLTDEHVISQNEIVPGLADRFRRLKISVIFSEGGFSAFNRLFPVLMSMPESERPAVMLRKTRLSAGEMRALYPRIRLEGLVSTKYEKLGGESASVVMDFLSKGVPVHPSVIPATEIES